MPSKAPAILLGAGAVHLLRQCLEAPSLLADARRVRRRIVAWGGAEPRVLPHEALVLSGGELHAALEAIAPPRMAREELLSPPFSIHTEAPFPEEHLHRFGERHGAALAVALHHEDDEGACWIEAVDTGWLFMIPSGPRRGWLLCVGGEPEDLLAQSRHLAPRITPGELPPTRFETAPRMRTRLSGPGWLACGTQAIAFDPLCGDGTAQAAREASLAAAVVHALATKARDEAEARCYLDHFHSMLLASLRRHLREAAQFYATGGQGPWWQAQLETTRQGFDWCSAQLATFAEPRYRLEGLTLTAIETPA